MLFRFMRQNHSQVWVRLGNHYQSNSPMTGDAVPHSMCCVTGTRPLAISRAFAHSIRTAASIVLGTGVQKLASLNAIATVALTAAAGDLLGAGGDTLSMNMTAPIVDETAVYFLA